jgi:hypothetical protein
MRLTPTVSITLVQYEDGQWRFHDWSLVGSGLITVRPQPEDETRRFDTPTVAADFFREQYAEQLPKPRP